MAKKKMHCKMEGCTREVFYKKSGLCQPCYSWLWYWKNKTPTQIMKRFGTLQFWEQRMASILPAKVAPIKKRKQA